MTNYNAMSSLTAYFLKILYLIKLLWRLKKPALLQNPARKTTVSGDVAAIIAANVASQKLDIKWNFKYI